MTKVYLVYMIGVTECNKSIKAVWAVFTNKHKAQVYCEYKKEITNNEWKKRFGMISVTWKVEEERIWNDDFTSQLNEIQTEKLPY